jgi:hypothetical protein
MCYCFIPIANGSGKGKLRVALKERELRQKALFFKQPNPLHQNRKIHLYLIRNELSLFAYGIDDGFKNLLPFNLTISLRL